MKTLTLTLILTLICSVGNAQKQEAFSRAAFRIDSLPKEGILLDKNWKWHAGDNPDFAKPDFDDSAWESIDPTRTIHDLPQIRKETIGWFRLKIHVDSSLLNKPLGFFIYQSIASEIYLDGKLLKQFGIVSSNNENIKAILPLNDPLGFQFDKPDQVMAVRFSVQPGLAYFTNSLPLTTLRIGINDFLRINQFNRIEPDLPILHGVYIGIFIVLTIIHFGFFLFHKKQKANLFFSLATLLGAIANIMHMKSNTSHDISFKSYSSQIVTPFYPILFNLFLLVAVYFLFSRPRKTYFWLLVIYSLASIFVYPRDWFWGSLLPLLLVILEAMRVAYQAYRQKFHDAGIIVYGFGFYLAFTFIYILMLKGVIPNRDLGLGDDFPLNVLIYHLSVNWLPLVLSIYFFRDFAFTSSILERKLVEVQQLSEENHQILTTQNEKLEIQVAERTAELVHKNRDLEIEAALDKIRSRSLTMHQSSELKEVTVIMFEKLKELGLVFDGGAGVKIFKEESKESVLWVAAPDVMSSPSRVNLPYVEDVFLKNPMLVDIWEARETGKDLFNKIYTLEQKDEYFNYVFSQNDDTVIPKSVREFILRTQSYTGTESYEKYTGVVVSSYTGELISQKQFEILKRLNKVFEQAYTRFLDLQKAEAQAREAEIELALERVRAKTMAMQKSHELREVAATIFEQLQLQGFNFGALAIVIMDELSGDSDWWMSGFGNYYPEKYKIPFFNHRFYLEQLSNWKDGEKYAVMEVSGEEKKMYDEYIFSQTDFTRVSQEAQNIMCGFEKITFSNAYMKHGALSWGTTPINEDDAKILQRFAKVFEQTYTRFLDLQKAEAQTREAQIEAVLERVRGRALAMQDPEELKEVASVLRTEMGLLGVEELEGSTIFIYDKITNAAECWFAIKDNRKKKKKMVADHIPLDLKATKVGREMYKFFSSDQLTTSIPMIGVDRKEWIHYCYELSPPLDGFYGENIPDRTYHLFKFTHGAIGVASAGDISEESWRMLSRASSVFSLAYSRFKDLTQARTDLIKLKDEKKRAEDALTELQATQKQLIQSEKMASLGELTAGIAHEIQNPLNFVNNFSEVTEELVGEVLEERKKEKGERALRPGSGFDENVVDELLGDIKENLSKIHHHGNRASSIVKGMLEHSRTSPGKKELTDINALAYEYLRLAYHGLRAKEKDFNAEFKTDFDPDLPKIEVVPQDIARVLLNLINNAFQATMEKAERSKQQGKMNYQPQVSITTQQITNNRSPISNNQLQITITDNGSGIPNSIKDKIFQPFFTTKDTGKGTGLGLSLAYDIVMKGHGGTLEVNSLEGEETSFIVKLPIS